jgi:hypothetical protein
MPTASTVPAPSSATPIQSMRPAIAFAGAVTAIPIRTIVPRHFG